jgi:hypothetical protein
MTPDLLPPRIEQKIDTEPVAGCWLWTAAINGSGYGIVLWNGRCRLAHRVIYELLVGPFPDGLQADHLCRNRQCVSPWHLEPVTSRVNSMRGETIGAAHAAKTHCPQGHPYSAENTYMRPGVNNRACRTCRREALRATARTDAGRMKARARSRLYRERKAAA